MKKTLLIVVFLFTFIFLISLVSAINYGDGIYGTNVYAAGDMGALYCGDLICNNGETCSSCSGDCGACPVSASASGGGGSRCDYNWQCTNWFPEECQISEVQERICINKGTCSGALEMPELNRTCVYEHKEPLFDIFLTISDKYKEICPGNKIKAEVKLENYGKAELLDAHMTYWIIDENNSLIAELKDTRAIVDGKNFEVELKIPESAYEGTYRLYSQITYNGDKTALAGETFEILSEQNCRLISLEEFNWNYLICAGLGIFVLAMAVIIIQILKRMRKLKTAKVNRSLEYRRKIHENLKKIKAKHLIIFIFSPALIFSLFSFWGNITGFAVNLEKTISGNLQSIVIIFSICVLGAIIFVYRRGILKFFRIGSRIYPSNSLRGLIEKEVYSEGGDYIGKIEEVLLDKGKIDGLRIKLDKKYALENKGIIIRYENIRHIDKIAIADENVLGKICNN